MENNRQQLVMGMLSFHLPRVDTDILHVPLQGKQVFHFIQATRPSLIQRHILNVLIQCYGTMTRAVCRSTCASV